mmetsp:Transcript_28648/g.42404  ORF Transcript_28648/g.42404 Transcript_28648/m.42404 type:complete len:148 (+) Transcript_28648:206-649(+)|eukprot:CAMPEP_0195515900 /NCGR_PEP_ID=MMETSP0794_2-20130614/6800_1 /TAXON_ID=515487 /ORGANISM="Stephanopyxis turris, Strain CCMP 815" /LENGTH=147 /DNA_ID=CAMNT_0040644395 /DNA_START=198 /DNA_END=641 /DNA_ORIENTATION=+
MEKVNRLSEANCLRAKFQDINVNKENKSEDSKLALDDNNNSKLREARQQRLKWRMNLFVFVQILLKYLEKVDPKLSLCAKTALQECHRKNKDGDPAYKSLATAIQLRLRQTVGELHWTRAEQIQRQAQFRTQRKKRERQQQNDQRFV